MSYKEKVIRSSQVASSTLFITRCTSVMLHVIYLISRLRRFKIFTIFSYGSLFVSVVIFITGPWIISAEQHMQISFFSDWSKGRKCMGIFRFFGGEGGKILCSYLFSENFLHGWFSTDFKIYGYSGGITDSSASLFWIWETVRARHIDFFVCIDPSSLLKSQAIKSDGKKKFW